MKERFIWVYKLNVLKFLRWQNSLYPWLDFTPVLTIMIWFSLNFFAALTAVPSFDFCTGFCKDLQIIGFMPCHLHFHILPWWISAGKGSNNLNITEITLHTIFQWVNNKQHKRKFNLSPSLVSQIVLEKIFILSKLMVSEKWNKQYYKFTLSNAGRLIGVEAALQSWTKVHVFNRERYISKSLLIFADMTLDNANKYIHVYRYWHICGLWYNLWVITIKSNTGVTKQLPLMRTICITGNITSVQSEYAKKVNETCLLLNLYLGHLAECLVFVQAFCKVSQCGPQYSMKAHQPFLSD